MKKLRLCIIDEALEMDIIDELLPEHPPIKYIAFPTALTLPKVTHGTLCTALLAGAVQAASIGGMVDITHYSITGKEERRAYSALLRALDWCIESHIDIISMSVGLLNRNKLEGLFERIDRLDQTLIVAAMSNSFELTYPASHPKVLGVARAFRNTGRRFIKRVSPPDGIDLIANQPPAKVLLNLENIYGESYDNSNSVLPPQLVAIIAEASLQLGMKPTKDLALRVLAGNNFVKAEAEYELPYPVYLDEDEKIPIIFISNKEEAPRLETITRLQNEFEERGYPCCILSNLVETNDFVNARYRLNQSCPEDCARYYQSIVSDSLILLHCSEEFYDFPSIDMVVNDWQDRPLADVCSEILAYFS